jgi:DNA-directed RNA polymerase specialized sigma24 family protein
VAGHSGRKFEKFPDLKSLLRYLQMCTNAVMVDFARWKEQAHLWDRAAETDDDTAEYDPFATLAGSSLPPERELARREMQELLWQKLQALSHSEKEDTAVFGYFVLNLKPREIFDLYPGKFEDVRDVSRTKDNFLARVRRNDEFRQFMDDA